MEHKNGSFCNKTEIPLMKKKKRKQTHRLKMQERMLCSSRRGTLPESPVFFSSCFGGPPMALPAALASPAADTFTGALGAIAL
jgi:hypothetical protein